MARPEPVPLRAPRPLPSWARAAHRSGLSWDRRLCLRLGFPRTRARRAPPGPPHTPTHSAAAPVSRAGRGTAASWRHQPGPTGLALSGCGSNSPEKQHSPLPLPTPAVTSRSPGPVHSLQPAPSVPARPLGLPHPGLAWWGGGGPWPLCPTQGGETEQIPAPLCGHLGHVGPFWGCRGAGLGFWGEHGLTHLRRKTLCQGIAPSGLLGRNTGRLTPSPAALQLDANIEAFWPGTPRDPGCQTRGALARAVTLLCPAPQGLHSFTCEVGSEQHQPRGRWAQREGH